MHRIQTQNCQNKKLLVCMYGEKIDSFPPSRLTDSESPKSIFGKHFSSLNVHSKWSLISGKFGKPWNVTGRIEEEDLACGC